MSFGIIRISKMTKGAVKGIEIHDQREKEYSHTNSDIDFSKSQLNYDLHNLEKINFNQVVKKRIDELSLKRAVRKDAIVMCQCLITSDTSFFQSMTFDEQKKFFIDCYHFVCDKFGRENIVSAVVHNDEKTPHIHINFVPVTADGRLCAKDLFKKSDLVQLHDDFYKYNQARGYDLQRGESKDIKQKHLTTEEFKLKMEYQSIEQQKKDIEDKEKEIDEMSKKLDKKKNTLEGSYGTIGAILKKFRDLDTIETKKTLTGQIKMNERDFNSLMSIARKVIILENENKKYEFELEKYKKLEEKTKSSVLEKMSYLKEIQELKKEYNSMASDFNQIVEYLENRDLIDDYQEYLEGDTKELIEDKQEYRGLEL